jgi:hypothetical protein
MRKLLCVLVATAFWAVQVTPVLAQAAPMPLEAPAAAIGGAYVVKKTTGACLRHPLLCAAAVVAGAGYLHHVEKTVRELDAETPACNGGYASLYRAVGGLERAEIAAIQRYVILPTGIGVKQFMLSFDDAKFIASFNQKFETSPTKKMFIVTSKVCASTLAMAERFSDVGHVVVSFTRDALKMVNLDASRTGGIQEMWASGASE